jgi:hypothetical protein
MERMGEKVASKASGAIRATKARVERETGVFEQLTREHGEVIALLERVRMSSELEVRAALMPRIRAELLSHEKGEATDVYPIFRQHEDLADFAEEHDTDVEQLEEAIAQLFALGYEDELWPSRFDDLYDLVTRHIREEEEEYFPAASHALGRDQSEQILRRYQMTKAGALKAQ